MHAHTLTPSTLSTPVLDCLWILVVQEIPYSLIEIQNDLVFPLPAQDLLDSYDDLLIFFLLVLLLCLFFVHPDMFKDGERLLG